MNWLPDEDAVCCLELLLQAREDWLGSPDPTPWRTGHAHRLLVDTRGAPTDRCVRLVKRIFTAMRADGVDLTDGDTVDAWAEFSTASPDRRYAGVGVLFDRQPGPIQLDDLVDGLVADSHRAQAEELATVLISTAACLPRPSRCRPGHGANDTGTHPDAQIDQWVHRSMALSGGPAWAVVPVARASNSRRRAATGCGWTCWRK